MMGLRPSSLNQDALDNFDYKQGGSWSENFILFGAEKLEIVFRTNGKQILQHVLHMRSSVLSSVVKSGIRAGSKWV